MPRINLKEAASACIRYSGIPLLIRNLYARTKVSIVKYHNPRPEILVRHLQYISKRYTFITMDRLVSALASGDWSTIPPKSMVITIDDGYKENLELTELFKSYKVIPTIFLCSQLVNTNRHFWWKELTRGEFESLVGRDHEEMLSYLRTRHGYDPLREYSEESRQTLNRDEMMKMQDVADFQSHTLSHPILTLCSEDDCRKEIFLSKREIEELTGRACMHFSYPNGDYADRERRFVREAGYASARTLDAGWNGPGTDPFALKITGVTDDASINLLAAQLSGITGYLRNLAQGSLTGKKPPLRRSKSATT